MGIYFNCFISLRPGLWTKTAIPLQDLGGRKTERGGERERDCIFQRIMSLLCMNDSEKVKSCCQRSQPGRRTVWLFHIHLIRMNKNVRCQSHINWWLITTILQGWQLWKDRTQTEIQSTGNFNLGCSLSPGNGAMHHECEVSVHWGWQDVFQLQI